jgi:hypothetical protein
MIVNREDADRFFAELRHETDDISRSAAPLLAEPFMSSLSPLWGAAGDLLYPPLRGYESLVL